MYRALKVFCLQASYRLSVIHLLRWPFTSNISCIDRVWEYFELSQDIKGQHGKLESPRLPRSLMMVAIFLNSVQIIERVVIYLIKFFDPPKQVSLCSAYKNKGVQLLLDGVTDYLPSPIDCTNSALVSFCKILPFFSVHLASIPLLVWDQTHRSTDFLNHEVQPSQNCFLKFTRLNAQWLRLVVIEVLVVLEVSALLPCIIFDCTDGEEWYPGLHAGCRQQWGSSSNAIGCKWSSCRSCFQAWGRQIWPIDLHAYLQWHCP